MPPKQKPYWTSAAIPAEDQILEELVRPESTVLDVGCGAGRSTLKLCERTDHVWAIDYNPNGLDRIAQHFADRHGSHVAASDMRELPFADCSFDVVLVALAGIDYLCSLPDRARAILEFSRVLKPGGFCVVSTHNRIGLTLSPQVWWNRKRFFWWLKHIVSFRFSRGSFIDSHGISMHQSSPRAFIRRVVSNTPLEFAYAICLSGATRNLSRVTLTSTLPYFVFAKKSGLNRD